MDIFEQGGRVRVGASGTVAVFPPSTRSAAVFWNAYDLAPLGRTLREHVRFAIRGLSKLSSSRQMADGGEEIHSFRARSLLSDILRQAVRPLHTRSATSTAFEEIPGKSRHFSCSQIASRRSFWRRWFCSSGWELQIKPRLNPSTASGRIQPEMCSCSPRERTSTCQFSRPVLPPSIACRFA